MTNVCYHCSKQFSTCVFNAGNLPLRHREIFRRNEHFVGIRLPDARELEPIERKYSFLSSKVRDIMKVRTYTQELDAP